MDSVRRMIRAGFLPPSERSALIALARDGSAAHRLARRANAVLLLDRGWSCAEVAEALLIDDDTVRDWHKLYTEGGFGALTRFEPGGSASHLRVDQQEALVAWIGRTLPRSTRSVGAYIESEFGVVYESRSGLIALLHRLGLAYRKPETIGRHLDAGRQQAFVAADEKLLNALDPDEAVVFVDAVHPMHATRAVGCWAPAADNLALEQTTGRQRLNIHGALDLETGKTAMIEVESVDAASTIRLLRAVEAMYPPRATIHVFLDNARYHHALLVREWLAQPGRRIALHFIPPSCPHLNPIERLWGLMHRHLTHNTCWPHHRRFAEEVLSFLREKVPKQWDQFRDSVADNFRVIHPEHFRVLT